MKKFFILLISLTLITGCSQKNNIAETAKNARQQRNNTVAEGVLKFNNGHVSPWVFVRECDSIDECASRCAYQSLDNFRISAQMRSVALGTPEHLIKALKGVDLSKCVGKPVQLNGYEIVVRKLAETKQIKR